VTQGGDDLARIALPDEESPAPDVAPLLAALKAALGDAVSDVRATHRLVDSAVVLSAGEHGPDLQMQRLLRRAGRAGVTAPPLLEINPRHRLTTVLLARQAAGRDMAEDAALLLDLARVQDGDLPRDPAAFARRIERTLADSA
nr:molecular chaperone HtpG [Rhodospirillales bacterium]